MLFPKTSLLAAFLCVSLAWGQFAIPEKPQQQTSVYDYINLLPAAQRKALEQKLLRYSDSTSTQIVVAIIATTGGENINFLGAQWGQQWGIGQAGKDNGVLILLAKDDRRIAINTGYGVESSLTDLKSKRIIETVILPEFKKGAYYRGLDQGVTAIFQVLQGSFKEERPPDKKTSPSLQLLWTIGLLIAVLFLLSRRGRNNGGRNGGQQSKTLDIWDMLILSSLGRSSGGFGGGGSGGFGGGFGGGGFGGGGASGGW